MISKRRLRSLVWTVWTVWTVFLKCLDKLQEYVPHFKARKEAHINVRRQTVSDVQPQVHLTSVLRIVICADTANHSTYATN